MDYLFGEQTKSDLPFFIDPKPQCPWAHGVIRLWVSFLLGVMHIHDIICIDTTPLNCLRKKDETICALLIKFHAANQDDITFIGSSISSGKNILLPTDNQKTRRWRVSVLVYLMRLNDHRPFP